MEVEIHNAWLYWTILVPGLFTLFVGWRAWALLDKWTGPDLYKAIWKIGLLIIAMLISWVVWGAVIAAFTITVVGS